MIYATRTRAAAKDANKESGGEMQQDLTFKEWLAALDAEARKYGQKGSYTEDSGQDCWLGFYQDGYSPEEAFREDCSYG